MRRFQEPPHPRILVRGFGPEIVATLATLFPSVRGIKSTSEVDQAEFDVIVARNMVGTEEAHLFAIVVAVDSDHGEFGRIAVAGGAAEVSFIEVSRATQFDIATSLPIPIYELVVGTLAPLASGQSGHGVLAPRITMNSPNAEVEGVVPWMMDTRGRVLAGSFRRSGGAAICWCLPPYISDPVPWVEAAIEIWHDLSPERFPHHTEWTARVRWQTPAERETVEMLERLQSERERVMIEMDTRAEEMEEALRLARGQADLHERRLLTCDDRDLVLAVCECFERFGFAVADMDDMWPVNDRREDLRVTSSETPDWTAIVEIHGSKGGGRMKDLLRLGRFQRRFQEQEGRPPSQSWYVVNQFLDVDPDEREVLLASNPVEVQTFAEDGGVVVDTRTLFQLWIQVEEGKVTPDTARRMLREATGRLELR